MVEEFQASFALGASIKDIRKILDFDLYYKMHAPSPSQMQTSYLDAQYSLQIINWWRVHRAYMSLLDL